LLKVRGAVRNYDEELPANTIRAWAIGLVLTTIASGLNSLFSLRAPSLTVTTFVVQMVAYPLGVGWAKVMPSHTFHTFGMQWSLNPGPFNIKEHGLIVIMANAAFGNGVAYFTDTLVAQRGFYGQNFGWGFNLMLAFSTQCVGFGLAGLMRKYLVEPASMIWPQTLVSTSFMYALHDHSKTDPVSLFLHLFLSGAWLPGS
jgi:OPT family oligopeptide transporter